MPSRSASDDTFETIVLKADRPVLVDFWAEWCGPCKQVAPALEDLSETWAGKVEVVKVNIEDAPMTATRFAVKGVPTFLLFKDGKVVSARQGAMVRSRIESWVDESV